MRPIQRMTRSRTGNMLINGAGAETLQDRGSFARSAVTLNPYYNINSIARWQEYTRWYMTSWEARKIIDIPVEDALRKPVDIMGLEEDDKRALEEACATFRMDAQVRRALIQERLLGGAIILPVFTRDADERTSERFDPRSIRKNDLRALNVVDVSRIARVEYQNDPLSPEYDKAKAYSINGVVMHASRLCVLDGSPLFGVNGNTALESRRLNGPGFGESKLATLYDLLNRVIGTQQGAFHLVNMASCLLVEVEHLRTLAASGSPALAKMREITEQLSIYRGAVVDGKDARVSQHSATFGSVPELVMTFAQLLSAASDIPATRFLGQAPGGLNATGEGDRENYYDMVASFQRLRIMPVHRRILDWIGASLWGWDAWEAKSRDLELKYPALKGMSEREEAEIREIRARTIQSLYEATLIKAEAAVAELVNLELFATREDAAFFLETSPAPSEEELGVLGSGIGPTDGGVTPATVSADEPTPQEVSLNGAQVTSMVQIVTQVAAGTLPRSSGVQMLLTAFPVSVEQAEAIMGEVGQGFIPQADPMEEQGGPGPSFA